MKLVKESISFERYKDPKKALGLDPLAPQSFSSEEEHAEYLVDLLPIILHGEIPEDFIISYKNSFERTETIHHSYYTTISNFLTNELDNQIDNPKTGERYKAVYVPEQSIVDILKNRGFKPKK